MTGKETKGGIEKDQAVQKIMITRRADQGRSQENAEEEEEINIIDVEIIQTIRTIVVLTVVEVEVDHKEISTIIIEDNKEVEEVEAVKAELYNLDSMVDY